MKKRSKRLMALLLASAMTITSLQMNWSVTAYAAEQTGAEMNGLAEIPGDDLEEEATSEIPRGGAASQSYNGYFDGLDSLQDGKEMYKVYQRDETREIGPSLTLTEDGVAASANMNYTWTATPKNGGGPITVKQDVSVNEIESLQAGLFYEGQQIGSYELSVDLLADGQSLGTEKVTYEFVCEKPIDMRGATEEQCSARKNETKTLNVRAYLDPDVYPGEYGQPDITYQWMKKVKDGGYTPMDGEDRSSIRVKVTDFDTSYKCVLDVADPNLGIQMEEKSCVFDLKESGGYRLKKASWDDTYGYGRQTVSVGSPADLFVEAQVDDGYTLGYQWQRAEKDADGATVFRPLAPSVDTATYKIPAVAETDLISQYYNDYSWTHRVEVKVYGDPAKTKQVGPTRYYYFCLQKEAAPAPEPFKIDSNLETWSEATQMVERGADVTLYVKHTPQTAEGYSIEKKWYRLQDFAFKAKTDANGDYVLDENNQPQYELEDASVTLPAGAEMWYYTSDDSSGYVPGTDACIRVVRTYRIKIDATENDSVYTIQGKNAAGQPVDNRGRYCVEVITKKGQDIIEQDHYYTNLIWDSKLKAYAKEQNISARVGDSISFEVAASNKNAANYPIAYQWQKRNAKGQYEDIPNAKDKAYTINPVKEDSFGEDMYQVIVSDLSKTRTICFSLDPKAPIWYTPEYSYYSLAVGETAKLEVKSDIPASSVSYNWYRVDKYIRYDEDSGYHEPDEQDWQILDATGPSYTATISPEDFPSEEGWSYKCEATYKLNGRNDKKEFYFCIRDAAEDDITLESTVPRIQYCEMGASASYGVRYKTYSTQIQEKDVVYQWSRNGEEIEGATGQTYTIDKLEAKDFGEGTVSCRVTFTLPGERVIRKWIDFETRLDTDVTVESRGKTIECALGAEVTLAPAIKNPSSKTLTYQWYFTNEDGGYWDDGMIPGATDAQYKISNISKTELGEYICRVYEDGCEIGRYRVTVRQKTHISIDPEQGDTKTVSAVLGDEAILSVNATSSLGLALHYQWYDRGLAIGGAIEPTYKISKVLPSMDNDRYYCEVTDAKENSVQSGEFYIDVRSDLSVDSGLKKPYSRIGHKVQLGGKVTLKADAKTADGYKAFYRWYKEDDEGNRNRIRKAESSELTLTNITKDDLGYYTCEITDESGLSREDLYYQVYVDTGLVVEPSIRYPRAASDGSITMYVKAKANKGETITYQWKKAKEGVDGTTEWADIQNATSRTYKIAKITKDTLGKYRCVVSTSGESYEYDFEVKTMCVYSKSRDYAVQGDSFTIKVEMVNEVADAKYTYKWYAEDPVTGAMKIQNATTASYTAKAPLVKDPSGSWENVAYLCEIFGEDGGQVNLEGSEWDQWTPTVYLRVLPTVTYLSGKNLPQTSHPFDKRVDIQGYKVDKAKNIKITLDTRSEPVLVIDASGHGRYMSGTGARTETLTGSSAIFIAGEDLDNNIRTTDGTGYGYKVSSIADASPKPSTPVKKVPAKGSKHKVGDLTYKVTKSDAKKGTVSVVGVKKKTLTSASVPKTVKLSGYTFKVTSIEAKAFKGCKKLTKATIQANVTSIGKQAFNGCTKLKSITIKTTKLTAKKVGSQAFKGINAKAKIKVPKNKVASYKKILKAKGIGKKVKVTK